MLHAARARAPLAVLPVLALVGGCTIAPDFLFGGAIDGVPSVIHVTSPDGGLLVPAVVTTPEEAQAATIYAELGPTGDAAPSGLTYEFLGTGGSVCAFVDPELLFWNQAVAASDPERRWRYPDNSWDDGDIDLRAGLSVYYTGTVGEMMGDFRVDYQDTLGNDIAIDLVACTIDADVLGPTPIATAGRGAPEYCTIFNTQPGVKYTVALEVFSTPPDDHRLGFGFLLTEGTCGAMIGAVSPDATPADNFTMNEECVIVGEALFPVEGEGQRYYGYAAGRSWEGSEAFELEFCSENPINQFCNAERDEMATAGLECAWENTVDDETGEIVDAANRCFCGDPSRTPTGGAF